MKDNNFINEILNKEETEEELNNYYDFMYYDNFSNFTKMVQNKMTFFRKYSLLVYKGPRIYKFSNKARLNDYQIILYKIFGMLPQTCI